MCAVAIAFSTTQFINQWTIKTLQLIIRTGHRLYVDARILYKTYNIEMCHLPRELFIGDISIQLQIPAPIEIDAQKDALMDFFELSPTSYLHLTNHCVAIIRVDETYFIFDPIMNGPTHPNYYSDREIVNPCIVRLDNFQKLIQHLQMVFMIPVPDVLDTNQPKLRLGCILCYREK